MYPNVTKPLSPLTDSALEAHLRSLVSEERRILTDILLHLREAERRMLYAKRGWSSLFEYAVHTLGYSESSAYRRIAAMRLIKNLPEESRPAIESKLQDGTLKLSQLAQVHRFVIAEKKANPQKVTKDETLNLVTSLENKSTRDTERALLQYSPKNESLSTERARTVETGMEIRFVADEGLQKKFFRIQELAAHRLGFSRKYSDLFNLIADLVLDVLGGKKLRDPSIETEAPMQKAKISSKLMREPIRLSRHIPIEIRRQLWRRDNGRCQYKDLKTGRRCGTSYGLEIDHKIPYSWGGSSYDLKNLQLLCRTHNQLKADHPGDMLLEQNQS